MKCRKRLLVAIGGATRRKRWKNGDFSIAKSAVAQPDTKKQSQHEKNIDTVTKPGSWCLKSR
jgi:hypothetical protein